jgi:PAS domain S-box-containing protein
MRPLWRSRCVAIDPKPPFRTPLQGSAPPSPRSLRSARRAAQHSAVAALGREALAGTSPSLLMDRAVNLLGEVLRADIAVILQMSADDSMLTPRATFGLDEHIVAGQALATEGDSLSSYTVQQHHPVVIADLAHETRFRPSPILLERGITSGLSVAIRGRTRPYGVLSMFWVRARRFEPEESSTLAAAANVVGMAIERANTEEQLRESESRSRFLASVVEQSEDAILTRTLDDVITSWNPGAENLYGYRADEAIGRKARELQLREIPESEYQRTLIRIRSASRVRFETRVTRKDGQHVYVFGVAGPMHDEAGRHLGEIVVARDVTELRKAREELVRLNNDLEQRVAARTTELEAAYQQAEALSYSIAHDLRAPLRAISGYARILEEELAPILPPHAQNYLERMGSNAVRLGTLIDALLSLQRLSRQPLARARVRLNQAVDDALDWLRGEHPGRDIEFEVGELGEADVDPALMGLAFANLLSNAIKFTRGHQPARVTVGTQERSGERIYFVQDNGAGFDMRYADKLFGVFQRLHPETEYEGNGVGLASVHRIVNRHGGRIWADAAVDRGATFYFTIGSPGEG